MKLFLKIIFILEVNIMKKITNQNLIDLASVIAKCSNETSINPDARETKTQIVMRSHRFIVELSMFLKSYFECDYESFDSETFIQMCDELVDSKITLDKNYNT